MKTLGTSSISPDGSLVETATSSGSSSKLGDVFKVNLGTNSPFIPPLVMREVILIGEGNRSSMNGISSLSIGDHDVVSSSGVSPVLMRTDSGSLPGLDDDATMTSAKLTVLSKSILSSQIAVKRREMLGQVSNFVTVYVVKIWWYFFSV